jgi:hypothetical protein
MSATRPDSYRPSRRALRHPQSAVGVALVALLPATPAAAQAQEDRPCTILCTPELKLEAIVIPFGDTSVHPFTGAPASAAGRQSIRDNGIELESELNIELFDTDRTAGWVSSHFDIVDKFSPGETPRAGSVYTHKLNFEWDTAFHVFNRAPSAPWLRNVEVELSLDYLATGLPKAGDIVGDERFLDKASPWSLSLVFVFPFAPLNP